MEDGRRCLFYLDHGDTDVNVFYKTTDSSDSEFSQDDGKEPRDDDGIIVFDGWRDNDGLIILNSNIWTLVAISDCNNMMNYDCDQLCLLILF